MDTPKTLDAVLDAGSKVKIMRLFISREKGFMASGREIARLIGLTAPATHAALKALYSQGLLKRDIIGRQHIYSLAGDNRIVERVLVPMFRQEILISKKIQSLQDKAELALKKAIREVVQRHKKSGRPLAIWRDGKVVMVPASRVSPAP